MSKRSWWPLGRDRAPSPPPRLMRPPPAPPPPRERLTRTKVIVVGNEKGGAGKTTLTSLLAVAMLYRGARVSIIDLDLRQSSLSHFLENRRQWLIHNRVQAPTPLEYRLSDDTDALSRASPTEMVGLFEEAIRQAASGADIVIIDTPGGDTPVNRAAHLQADLVVTPLNDSFVDFDVLGVIDPMTLELKKPSHYARVVHEARKMRAAYGRELEWVVMPNRLAPTEPRNRERLTKGLEAMSGPAGFRIAPSLHERVIYRELYPFGLTVVDLGPGLMPVKVSARLDVVKAEVEAVLAALGLDRLTFEGPASPLG